MTNREFVVELFQALALPAVIAVAVVVLRQPIGELISKTRKLSIRSWFSIEVEPARRRPDVGPLTELPSAHDAGFSSYMGPMIAALAGREQVDYAVVDLGSGRSWLTSRLWLASELLERLHACRWIVFVADEHSRAGVYQLTARSDVLRYEIERRAAYLPAAFAAARARPPHRRSKPLRTSRRTGLSSITWAPLSAIS